MTTTNGPGRPRDPDVDRRISQAALDVFGELGWAGFAMETVAKRAGIGKASLYLRWSGKEALLTDAIRAGLPKISDVDTGTLHGDLVELATQVLALYVGPGSRAALRLHLEAASIAGVAEHYAAMRTAQISAARHIIRRGIDRAELPAGTSVTLLLDTLVGGAMMHALTTPPGRRDTLAAGAAEHARALVDFLLHAVAAPA
ncbi:TetR family transcriptional regulator [Actinoplanes ianthinogenes]|uniref:TetR family transcriptional regulator n=1 Tax=Actinoplanes ianthinogenes TaxID=122358 RepID=A0ABM7M811_9ACTN|nr:TetR/AcrR family transcriptional regulator [Actinoplanes ianthinogenes]BCJ47799.1 TetR family transcriptional regulator [Actinoplanes ianthinogenes]GGR04227.1 TetR family transcriptional regulator [Actinoplanes ianthinogenes]